MSFLIDVYVPFYCLCNYQVDPDTKVLTVDTISSKLAFRCFKPCFILFYNHFIMMALIHKFVVNKQNVGISLESFEHELMFCGNFYYLQGDVCIHVHMCTFNNTVLILCFIYYLIPTLIFLCKTRLKMGFSFTVLIWILMYKLETIIFWIIIAFFLQSFLFFCFFIKEKQNKTRFSPYLLCLRLKPRSCQAW